MNRINVFKLTPDEIISRLNDYIKREIVTYDHKQDDSTLVWVWGLRQAEFNGMVWYERKGCFLGGGISESYGYSLTHNGQSIHGLSYVTSLRMFLNYIHKCYGW